MDYCNHKFEIKKKWFQIYNDNNKTNINNHRDNLNPNNKRCTNKCLKNLKEDKIPTNNCYNISTNWTKDKHKNLIIFNITIRICKLWLYKTINEQGSNLFCRKKFLDNLFYSKQWNFKMLFWITWQTKMPRNKPL